MRRVMSFASAEDLGPAALVTVVGTPMWSSASSVSHVAGLAVDPVDQVDHVGLEDEDDEGDEGHCNDMGGPHGAAELEGAERVHPRAEDPYCLGSLGSAAVAHHHHHMGIPSSQGHHAATGQASESHVLSSLLYSTHTHDSSSCCQPGQTPTLLSSSHQQLANTLPTRTQPSSMPSHVLDSAPAPAPAPAPVSAGQGMPRVRSQLMRSQTSALEAAMNSRPWGHGSHASSPRHPRSQDQAGGMPPGTGNFRGLQRAMAALLQAQQYQQGRSLQQGQQGGMHAPMTRGSGAAHAATGMAGARAGAGRERPGLRRSLSMGSIPPQVKPLLRQPAQQQPVQQQPVEQQELAQAPAPQVQQQGQHAQALAQRLLQVQQAKQQQAQPQTQAGLPRRPTSTSQQCPTSSLLGTHASALGSVGGGISRSNSASQSHEFLGLKGALTTSPASQLVRGTAKSLVLLRRESELPGAAAAFAHLTCSGRQSLLGRPGSGTLNLGSALSHKQSSKPNMNRVWSSGPHACFSQPPGNNSSSSNNSNTHQCVGSGGWALQCVGEEGSSSAHDSVYPAVSVLTLSTESRRHTATAPCNLVHGSAAVRPPACKDLQRSGTCI